MVYSMGGVAGCNTGWRDHATQQGQEHMGLKDISLPIFAGILQGKQYLLWSKGKLVRVLMGTYEPELTHLLIDSLDDGGVFWDIGAHAGYYSMVAAQLVGRSGEIVAFEP